MTLSLTPYVLFPACFMVGVLLGIAFFATLARVVRCFAEGRALMAAGLQLARFAALVGALFVFVRLGAFPLLTGAAGVFFGRHLVMRRGDGQDGETPS